MLIFEKEKYSSYHSKTFRLPDEIIDKLEKIAMENNSSVNRIVIQCLEYAISEAASNETPESNTPTTSP